MDTTELLGAIRDLEDRLIGLSKTEKQLMEKDGKAA
jgi:hypothetical protein